MTEEEALREIHVVDKTDPKTNTCTSEQYRKEQEGIVPQEPTLVVKPYSEATCCGKYRHNEKGQQRALERDYQLFNFKE